MATKNGRRHACINLTSEQRFPKQPRENVVEVKMHLRDDADIMSCMRIDRDQSFDPELIILTRPDYARIDRPGRDSTTAVHRRRHGKFHQWNEMVEWSL